MKRLWLVLVLFAMALPAWAAGATGNPEANREIEALIASVGKLPGAVFIRNGSEHSAAQAADHLRLKWKNAGSRVHSAEDFIRLCATGSSMTGTAYRIRLADGTTMDSAAFFHARLAELRRRDAAAAR